ncbi:MAG: hypothetical protein R3313_03310, partial [Candidatus Saccharimonadales bacterium]|nr:hypothetical protein [Candidatus Saccharimonadales bacterium]
MTTPAEVPEPITVDAEMDAIEASLAGGGDEKNDSDSPRPLVERDASEISSLAMSLGVPFSNEHGLLDPEQVVQAIEQKAEQDPDTFKRVFTGL